MFLHAIRYEGLTAGTITSHAPEIILWKKKKTKYRIEWSLPSWNSMASTTKTLYFFRICMDISEQQQISYMHLHLHVFANIFLHL